MEVERDQSIIPFSLSAGRTPEGELIYLTLVETVFICLPMKDLV